MNEMTPTQNRVLVTGLALYAALSLICMASMSIGAGLLAICLLYAYGGPVPFFSRLWTRLISVPSARKLAWVTLAFVIACMLSLLNAKFHPLAIAGKVTHVRVWAEFAKTWYFIWPFVIWMGLEGCTRKQRELLLKVWLWVFLVLSVIGIFQHYTGWPRPQVIPTDPKYFHATLFLGHHLSVASILIFPFFALLELPLLPPFFRWAAAVCGFVTLMFTFSRTLWVALPIGLAIWAFLRFGRKARVALILIFLVGGGVASQLKSVRTRLENPMGIHTREDLWEANWVMFQHRPIIGVGLRQNQNLSGYFLMQKYHTNNVFQGHAHDNFLDILSTTGAVGELAFLAWWLFVFWMVVRLFDAKGYSPPSFVKGVLAALIVYQLNGLTQVNFWEGKVQHQLMWILAWVLLWTAEAEKRSGEKCALT